MLDLQSLTEVVGNVVQLNSMKSSLILGGTTLYKPYMYAPLQRVGFLCCFGLKTGTDFAHFGLELGMVFKGSA